MFFLETWWRRPGWPFSTEIKCDSVITWNLIILTACVPQGHFSLSLAFLAVKPWWDWVTCGRLAQEHVLSFPFRPFFCFNDSPLRRSPINTACRGLGPGYDSIAWSNFVLTKELMVVKSQTRLKNTHVKYPQWISVNELEHRTDHRREKLSYVFADDENIPEYIYIFSYKSIYLNRYLRLLKKNSPFIHFSQYY